MNLVRHWKNVVPRAPEAFTELSRLQYEQAFEKTHLIAKNIQVPSELPPTTATLLDYYSLWIQEYFEKVCKLRVSVHLTQINRYHDEHYCDWHSDDPEEIGVSISLGAPRQLQFRLKNTEEVVETFDLEEGDLFISHGNIERTHEHRVLPSKAGTRLVLLFYAEYLPYEPVMRCLTPFKPFNFDHGFVEKRRNYYHLEFEARVLEGEIHEAWFQPDMIVHSPSREGILRALESMNALPEGFPRSLL